MNGSIIELPHNPLPGFVLGSDGNRYPFDVCDIYSSPSVGDRVFFIRDGVTAARITKLEYNFDEELHKLRVDITRLQQEIDKFTRRYK